MKKRIGILTYHTGYNYGASLQAYALQTMIKKLGLECEIINFETDRFVASREMFSRSPKRLKEWIKIVSRLPYYRSLKKRQALFDEYTRTCLNITPRYKTEDEVIHHAEDYHTIVCGSDQIWNLSQNDAPAANPIFFLNFEKKQRRVSYAASFGKWVKEAAQSEDVFLKWLKEFDMLSVRETSGVDYVKSLGLDCELVLDPTLLLDANEYNEICRERLIDEPYVLLFSWACTSEVVEVAKKVAKELNLRLINIVPPPRAMFKGVERKLDVGPREFLSMVKHAEFVVTNSFHGTVFSTTFEKPFVSLVSGEADPRMKSILSQLGLAEFLVTADKVDVKKSLKVDYSKVADRKVELRKTSIDYLKRALEVE